MGMKEAEREITAQRTRMNWHRYLIHLYYTWIPGWGRCKFNIHSWGLTQQAGIRQAPRDWYDRENMGTVLGIEHLSIKQVLNY